MSDSTNVYAEILKFDDNGDGTLTVYGKATDDSLDIDEQICDPVWLDRAMPDWFRTGGNIREQHSNIAAGVAKEYESKADGHYISALVVDPVSVKKVQNRVLRGFSIGIKSPRVVRDTKAANGRIIDGQIVEVSLVDRPANPNCQLILAKSVLGEKTLLKTEELIEKYNENPNPATNKEPKMARQSKAEKSAIEKEVATDEETSMNGEAKAVPSRDEMIERYAGARKALDDVTMECKSYGYDDIDKAYGETAEEESAEGPAGSGAEHEVGEAEGKKELVDSDGNETDKSPTLTEIIPDPSIEVLPTITEETIEEFVEDDSASKTLLADAKLDSIIEKAVKSAMKSVEAEVAELKTAYTAVENKAASLETELATAKSLAIGGGPKRATIATGATTTNEWKGKADLYFAKASSTTDQILAKGYRDMAKDFLAKSVSSAE